MRDTAHSRAIALALETADALEAGRAFVAAEAAASLRFMASQLGDYRAALTEEIDHSTRLRKDCEEMSARLFRLEEHLRNGIVREVMGKLADYAGSVGHEDLDDPPADPFPEPEAPKRRRKK